MKKYVFFDIDGTLLPEGEKVIPKSTVDALKELKKNNVEPVICTGRCYHQAKKFIDQIGADSYIVSNGQEVNIEGELIYEYDLSEIEKNDIIKNLEAAGINWGYETRERIYLADIDNAKKVKDILEGYGLDEIHIDSTKLGEKIKQMWAFGDSEKIVELEQKIINNFKFFKWSPFSIEIISSNESKGKGVRKAMEKFKNHGTTYAFGDGFNDIELFEAVDISVAMGNARTEVKSVATKITANSQDDGIRKGLKDLGLIK